MPNQAEQSTERFGVELRPPSDSNGSEACARGAHANLIEATD